jgi:hypothetical protein
MPDLLNPLTAIAGPESSFGTNLQNPNSSASGDFGIINATWQANLIAIGGDPAQYPTAISAPANIQAAVTAHLYNTRGFADYTCTGCDAVLTRNIADAGGPSAFLPQGSLSENPADYLSLNTPAGLQAYFNANPGGSFVGSVGMQQTPAGAAAIAAANNSPTSKPFSYVYSLIVDSAAPVLGDDIAKVQGLTQPWLAGAITLAVVIAGISMALGRSRIEHFAERAIRMGIVSVFAVTGSLFYAQYVQATVVAAPALISAAFGATSGDPMAVFDDSSSVMFVIAETIFGETPVNFKGFAIIALTGVTFVIGEFLLWALAFPYIATVFLLLLTLVFGPIAIVAAIFRTMDRWLLGFANQLMTLAAQLLAIIVVITVFQTAIVNAMQGFALSGNPDSDYVAFLGIVGMLGVMAFIADWYLPRLVSGIFGGSGGIQLGAAFRVAR